MTPQEQLENYTFCQVLCERAMEHIKTDIDDYLRELELGNEKPPIKPIETRIKSFESAREKCRSRKIKMTIDSMLTSLRDIAGIRITTLYIDDVYSIAEALKIRFHSSIPDDGIRDRIVEPKDNGYRSFHIVVQKALFFKGRTYIVPVEIQIRTIVMDVWAALEHDLVYKKEGCSEAVKTKFRDMADYLNEVDTAANALHQKAVAKP